MALGSYEKACAGSFWWEVGKIKTLSGEPRFSKLHQLMAGLLTIPCSNAMQRGASRCSGRYTQTRGQALASLL